MRKYLIINADDYGLSEQVNTGIVQAHQFGTITSTSMLVNMPGFEHGVSLAQEHPALGIGLHLNLVMGTPVCSPDTIPSLVGEDGTFSWNTNAWKQVDIEREAFAQLHKLYAVGVFPTHLDSHLHIHLEVPLVYTVVTQLAKLHQLAVRSHNRISSKISLPLCTEHLILDTYDEADGVARLCHHIQHLHLGTTELMCHPGLFDDIVYPNSPHPPDKRVRELSVLLDPNVLYTIQEHAQLIHYGHLPSITTSYSRIHLPPVRPRRRPRTRSISKRLLRRTKPRTRGARNNRYSRTRLSNPRRSRVRSPKRKK